MTILELITTPNESHEAKALINTASFNYMAIMQISHISAKQV